jgi:hypothetical protein
MKGKLSLSGKELGALNVLLSSISVEELVKAARVGFNSLEDNTSANDEASMLCTFVLKSLHE